MVTKRKPDNENFVPLVAVGQQKVTPCIRYEPARGDPVPDTEVKETMLTLLEPFYDSLTDADTVLVSRTRPAEKDAGRDPVGRTELPFVGTDAGGDPHAEEKQASVIGTSESTRRLVGLLRVHQSTRRGSSRNTGNLNMTGLPSQCESWTKLATTRLGSTGCVRKHRTADIRRAVGALLQPKGRPARPPRTSLGG